eukprot:2915056-Alexandrium_andersonii.AAC.1
MCACARVCANGAAGKPEDPLDDNPRPGRLSSRALQGAEGAVRDSAPRCESASREVRGRQIRGGHEWPL